MRLALVTHSSRRVGGVESYLEALAAGMVRRGHCLALCSGNDAPPHRPPIALPAGAVKLHASEPGGALKTLWDWEPDVLFTHGLLDPKLEAALLRGHVPTAVLLHGYYGACISGHKAWSAPGTPRPCKRPFGVGCLLHYYPHRCGGLSPRAMWRDYVRQSRRRRLLERYGARLVFSAHLAREYARLGLSAEVLPEPPSGSNPVSPNPLGTLVPDELRLLFMGRMEELKGGAVLLQAVADLLAADPCRRVRLDLAGQGSAEASWRRRATALETRWPGRCEAHFHGWLDAEGRGALLAEAHLLIVPSLWPEPLGLVGPEAAARGVPAVAFAVGGIPEWLHDGENGVLAPGDPPTAGGLAQAIRRATDDPAVYTALRTGAFRSAKDAAGRAEKHFAALETVLTRISRQPSRRALPVPCASSWPTRFPPPAPAG